MKTKSQKELIVITHNLPTAEERKNKIETICKLIEQT